MKTTRDYLSRNIALIIVVALVFSNLHLSAFAANANGIKIDKNNFPDDVFRKVISGSDYDRDGNGYLDDKEIGLTINIYCEGMGIKSIKGVEFFTALQGLWCKDNKIKTMDLSNNKDLRGVWCSGNQYTSLDFSDNPELLWVYCYDCNLTSLNVSNNPKMAFIECNTNPLKELDVSKNPELEHLTCGTCELSELDLSNNPKLTHLDAFSNKLTRLDISNCPKMKRLDIWNNKGLGSIDISNNPGLQFYNCAYNHADSIDVSKNPELQKLICSYNDIKKLDLSNNLKLVYLDCACNEIDELDISHNINLHFLQAFTNAFTKLDIGNNPYLVKAYKEGVKKNESKVCKGHSWTIDFGGETSTGEDNIYFLCFDDAVKLSSELKANANNTQKDIEYSDLDSGIPDEEYVTRELVAETLYEMAGCPVAKGIKSKFSDVEAGSWYENAIIWGENNYICIGSPDISSDTFGVGKWITREDLALMMMRYSEYMGYKRAIDFGRSDDYLDYYDIDYYAWEAITWAATWNIMSGKGGETKDQQKVEPHGRVTFAELKEILKNMLSVNDISAEVTIPDPADTNIDYSANTIVRDYKTNAYYKVTSTKKLTVTFSSLINKNVANATIPANVTLGGKTYKVTAIAANAFKNNKKLKKVTIGKNIAKIGKKAFYGCKKLKKINIKTIKLTGKKVGKKAFAMINSKAKFRFPKNKRKVYKRIF